MFNETASSTADRPALRSSVRLPLRNEDSRYSELREFIASVLMIQEEDFEPQPELFQRDGVLLLTPDSKPVASFSGRLLLDSEAAYDQLDTLLKPLNYVPVFRAFEDKHVIHVLSGRARPAPRAWWPNALLFAITVFSVLMLGTQLAINEIASENVIRAQALINNFFFELWRGLPYAISILLILGAHELGHYFAARRHKIAVTLPYFIPAPFVSFLGTFGAFIQLREPMRNRKVLFDVGAAGPLAGLIFAIPILFIGLATSHVGPLEPGGALEGNSIFYAFAKFAVFGRFLPDATSDVFINQVALAGWAGLLVTALNLIPVGQLDGGHILFSLIGNNARKLYYPFVIAAVVLALRTEAWLIWVLMLLFFGRTYAAPLDMITPLDVRRRALGVLSLVAFVLLFVPVPVTIIEGARVPPGVRESVYAVPLLTAGIAVLWQRLRRQG